MTDLPPCFVCDCKFDPAMGDGSLQPHGGLVFYTAGGYGSTLYDPPGLEPNLLAILVCDDCVETRSHYVRERIRLVYPIEYRYERWEPGGER